MHICRSRRNSRGSPPSQNGRGWEAQGGSDEEAELEDEDEDEVPPPPSHLLRLSSAPFSQRDMATRTRARTHTTLSSGAHPGGRIQGAGGYWAYGYEGRKRRRRFWRWGLQASVTRPLWD